MLRVVYVLTILLLVQPVAAQKKDPEAGKTLLLQLSSGFLSVIRDGSIDLDSSLLYSARYHHLSLTAVISDGIDDDFARKYCRWMDSGETAEPRNQLLHMEGKSKARLMVLLGAYYAFRPGSDKKYIDSGIYWLSLAYKKCSYLGEQRLAGHASCLLAKCYLKAGKLKQGYIWFDRALNNRGSTDRSVSIKALSYQGTYYPFSPATIPLRIAFLARSEQLSARLLDTSGQISALGSIAYLNFARQDLAAAEKASLKSYTLQIRSGFPYRHYTTDLLSLINYIKGVYVPQLSYALESLSTATTYNDRLGMAIFYTRVGDAFSAGITRKAEAVEWYRKALDEFLATNDGVHAYRVLTHINNIKIDTDGDSSLVVTLKRLLISSPPRNSIDRQDAYIALAEANRKLKHFTVASQYYSMAQQLVPENEKIRGDFNNPVLLFMIGRFYWDWGKLDQSRSFLIQFTGARGANLPSPYNLADAYWYLHKIEGMRKNYQESMIYLQKFKSLTDSLRRQNIQLPPGDRQELVDTLKRSAELAGPGQKKRFSFALILLLSASAILLIASGMALFYFYGKKKQLGSTANPDSSGHDDQLEKAFTDKKELQRSKQRLLKEINNRVQNNLQIVIDLLRRQSIYIHDPDALEAIGKSQSRMMAMSLIHEGLDHSTSGNMVAFDDYILKMTEFLTGFYMPAKNVTFDLNLAGVSLTLNQAVPLGLIVNEILTNSIKHSFAAETKPFISVRLTQLSENRIRLNITDNGTGLPDNFDVSASGTLGFNLILGLAAQLDAIPVFRNAAGLMAEITFEQEQ